MADREHSQWAIAQWITDSFGADSMALRERTLRFMEESLELAQAAGLEPVDIERLLAYVYSRPAGTVPQEVGGVSVTLLALCESFGCSADHAEIAEVTRCLAFNPTELRERHNAKTRHGVSDVTA